jgi:hypothetical protein
VTATETLTVTPESLQRRTEKEDIPLCAMFGSAQVVCIFDSGYGNRERALSVLSTVQPGDTVLLTGREEKNPGADMCAFDTFTWYSIRRMERKERDSLGTAQGPSSATGFHIPLWVWLVALGVLLVLLHSMPSLHLWRLRRSATKSESGARRLAAAREWLMMILHLNGYPTARETDMEYALRLVDDPGAEVRVFFAAYRQSRYYDMAVPSTPDLVNEMIEETVQTLRAKRSIFRRLWAHIHLWEYFRVLNRKRTA